MRFRDFLKRTDWSASYRGAVLGAASASDWVAAAGERLYSRNVRAAGVPAMAAPETETLTVFVTFSPLEALLCFFLASDLGLLAAVMSPRTLGDVVPNCGTGMTVRFVLLEGRRVPASLVGREVLLLPAWNSGTGHDTIRRAASQAARWAAAPTQPEGDGWSGARAAAARWADRVMTQTSEPDPGAASQWNAAAAPTRQARLVFCSSGTTGTPKRIVYDEETLVANAAVVTGYLGIDSSDRSLCAFPITYMYGLSTTLCALHSGSRIDYVDFTNARLMASDAERLDSTVLPILGDWSRAIVDEWQTRRFRSQRLRLLNASDRITVQQVLALRGFCGQVWNNFGQTESGPRLFALDVTRIDSFDRYEHDGIIAPGYPVHPDIQTMIHEPTSRGVGPLLYRSPFAMRGLLRSDLTLDPAPEWIPSGDNFQRDWDGLHKWGGRTAHMIKISGQLFSLRALADGLLSVPGVTDVGYAKSDTGMLFLFAEVPDDTAGSERSAAIRAMVDLMLPTVPYRLRFVDALPRTETGKLDARALSRTLAEEAV